MATINEVYSREMRDSMGRYPNWPLNKTISLGNIGTYHGRSANFEWRTSLKELGIIIPEPAAQATFMDELFCSNKGVNIDFRHRQQDNLSLASFKFKKNRSIATQGHQTAIHQLPIGELELLLRRAIHDGLKWDKDWLIITELWSASGFSMLMSGSDASLLEISAQSQTPLKSFNIADTELGLQVHRSRAMGYQGIAKAGIKPFFQVHKLVYNPKIDRYYLKLYGNDSGFWNKKWNLSRFTKANLGQEE